MPKGGYYFDAIICQEEFDKDNLKVDGNLEEFQPISDEGLLYYIIIAGYKLHSINLAENKFKGSRNYG